MAEAPAIAWDPDLFARAETLEWRSRVLVEGFLQGLHRSRLRGFSSEFSQYQPYIQGDDLRYADWRAFGRLDRLYIRQFEAETNLRCQILLDASGSMAYRSEESSFRKCDYAALIAASLMRLLLTQHDAFGISLARKELAAHLPPRVNRLHFFRCLGVLETIRPEGIFDVAACINALAELFPKRGLVVIFTDTWDNLEHLIEALQRLRYEHHEICLFQVVDPREMDFAFKDSRLFQDMESGARMPVTPDWNRTRYLAALEKHQTRLRQQCLDLGVMHRVLPTDQPPFEAMAAFLAERESHP
ncbi:MAG: DUF58 domain-containing protein [Verrucomicrobia bacterium]|nr:DUF58 domain-containing protein [Verrucomicrobiota bacterium]